jgi:hypothetical protein
MSRTGAGTRPPAGWWLLLGLTLAAQVSALSLVNAPRYAIYQHYRTWPDILSGGLLQAALIAAELALAVIILRRHQAAVRSGVRAGVGPFRVVLALGVVLCASVVPAVSAVQSLQEIVTALVVTSASALALLALSVSLPASTLEALRRWTASRLTLPGAEAPGTWDSRLPWCMAAWAVLLSAAAAWFAFERLPHINDSVTYLFQAKYFAAGRLYLPAPPDSAAFVVNQTLSDGTRWWGYGFPGWPAVLSLGALAGVPWLVNPLLAGVAVLLTHAVVRRLYDRGTANATVILLGVSPWLIYMSAEFMPHPVSLVWTLLTILAVLRAAQSKRWAWLVLAGASLGALFLTRPIEAFLIAPVIAVWAVGPFGPRLRVLQLGPMVVAGALVAALSLPYNAALTGDPMYPPFTKFGDVAWGVGTDRIGFGPDVGHGAWPSVDPIPGHGLPDVVLNANKNLFMANFELFGWGCGSLLLLLAGFVAGGWDRRDALGIGIVMTSALGYSIYWFSGGPDLGPRYWYQAIVPLAFLTVRGAGLLGKRLRHAAPASATRVAVFVALASLIGMLTVVPWRYGKYHEYRDVGGAVRRLAAAHHFGHALVLIRTDVHEDYQSAFSLNPPTLERAGTVYAWDRNPAARARIVGAFPDRAVWVVERGPETADTLAVRAGPLPPGSVPP